MSINNENSLIRCNRENIQTKKKYIFLLQHLQSDQVISLFSDCTLLIILNAMLGNCKSLNTVLQHHPFLQQMNTNVETLFAFFPFLNVTSSIFQPSVTAINSAIYLTLLCHRASFIFYKSTMAYILKLMTMLMFNVQLQTFNIKVKE